VVKLLMFMLILSTLVQFIHDYFHFMNEACLPREKDITKSHT